MNDPNSFLNSLKSLSNVFEKAALHVFMDRATKAGAVDVYSSSGDGQVEFAAVFEKFEECAIFTSKEFSNMHRGMEIAGIAGVKKAAISSSLCAVRDCTDRIVYVTIIRSCDPANILDGFTDVNGKPAKHPIDDVTKKKEKRPVSSDSCNDPGNGKSRGKVNTDPSVNSPVASC